MLCLPGRPDYILFATGRPDLFARVPILFSPSSSLEIRNTVTKIGERAGMTVSPFSPYDILYPSPPCLRRIDSLSLSLSSPPLDPIGFSKTKPVVSFLL